MVRDTQASAWEDLQSKLGARHNQVLETIQAWPNGMTMFQVAMYLGWPINRISGRITELCALGAVRDSGRRDVNPSSGRKVIVWEIVPANDKI